MKVGFEVWIQLLSANFEAFQPFFLFFLVVIKSPYKEIKEGVFVCEREKGFFQTRTHLSTINCVCENLKRECVEEVFIQA